MKAVTVTAKGQFQNKFGTFLMKVRQPAAVLVGGAGQQLTTHLGNVYKGSISSCHSAYSVGGSISKPHGTNIHCYLLPG